MIRLLTILATVVILTAGAEALCVYKYGQMFPGCSTLGVDCDSSACMLIPTPPGYQPKGFECVFKCTQGAEKTCSTLKVGNLACTWVNDTSCPGCCQFLTTSCEGYNFNKAMCNSIKGCAFDATTSKCAFNTPKSGTDVRCGSLAASKADCDNAPNCEWKNKVHVPPTPPPKCSSQSSCDACTNDASGKCTWCVPTTTCFDSSSPPQGSCDYQMGAGITNSAQCSPAATPTTPQPGPLICSQNIDCQSCANDDSTTCMWCESGKNKHTCQSFDDGSCAGGKTQLDPIYDSSKCPHSSGLGIGWIVLIIVGVLLCCAGVGACGGRGEGWVVVWR